MRYICYKLMLASGLPGCEANGDKIRNLKYNILLFNRVHAKCRYSCSVARAVEWSGLFYTEGRATARMDCRANSGKLLSAMSLLAHVTLPSCLFPLCLSPDRSVLPARGEVWFWCVYVTCKVGNDGPGHFNNKETVHCDLYPEGNGASLVQCLKLVRELVIETWWTLFIFWNMLLYCPTTRF